MEARIEKHYCQISKADLFNALEPLAKQANISITQNPNYVMLHGNWFYQYFRWGSELQDKLEHYGLFGKIKFGEIYKGDKFTTITLFEDVISESSIKFEEYKKESIVAYNVWQVKKMIVEVILKTNGFKIRKEFTNKDSFSRENDTKLRTHTLVLGNKTFYLNVSRYDVLNVKEDDWEIESVDEISLKVSQVQNPNFKIMYKKLTTDTEKVVTKAEEDIATIEYNKERAIEKLKSDFVKAAKAL